MASNKLSLAGKVALITGASSGIGAGTAILFSELGATLAITGRNKDNLNKTRDECEKKSNNKPFVIIGDMNNESDVKRIVDETIKNLGRLDILVNNAGILEFGSIENASLEHFDRVMNTNLRTVYHLTMLCAPHLTATKGNIVNVSSVCGLRSVPNMLTYNMSKSGLDAMTRCVALELAPKQVRCNAVNPGLIVTDIHKRAGMDDATYAAMLERCKVTYAMGRSGNVDEVSQTIAFLASDAASFITGATLPVDGGRHAMCPR